MAFFINLLIALVLTVISYLIAPKPKQPQPAGVRDLEKPTADAGRPLPTVFGTMRVKGINSMWYGDLVQKKVKVKA